MGERRLLIFFVLKPQASSLEPQAYSTLIVVPLFWHGADNAVVIGGIGFAVYFGGDRSAGGLVRNQGEERGAQELWPIPAMPNSRSRLSQSHCAGVEKNALLLRREATSGDLAEAI